MANRSRLGRDPLQAAPKPSASKTATRRKPAAAKSDASADTARKKPVAAANDSRPLPDTLTAASSVKAAVIAAPEQSQPSAEAPSPTISPTQAATIAASAQPASAVSSKPPAAAPDEATGPVPEAGQSPVLPSAPGPDQKLAVADSSTAAPVQAQEAAALGQTDSMPASDAAASEEACPAACSGMAGPALSTDAHPVAVFLRGVLEGLLPEGEAALCVDVDESTSALPVEKLFFFSHALQRIAMPLENAASAGWRPGTATGPLPVLTARLRPIGRGRHSLTLFDNGCFFKTRLPGLSLDMEALTPLTTFVAKRQGSVILAQGRVTAFEIIG
ncbi:MAG TPA: hypothetical protein PKC79_10605 [Solidesulfovibrio magneticus]|nr:hypothetical protein [Solidesulfovibrio magneticus]